MFSITCRRRGCLKSCFTLSKEKMNTLMSFKSNFGSFMVYLKINSDMANMYVYIQNVSFQFLYHNWTMPIISHTCKNEWSAVTCIHTSVLHMFLSFFFTFHIQWRMDFNLRLILIRAWITWSCASLIFLHVGEEEPTWFYIGFQLDLLGRGLQHMVFCRCRFHLYARPRHGMFMSK